MKYFILSFAFILMACGTTLSKKAAPKNVSDYIKVTSPQPFAKVSETLIVKGEARGTFFFEGDFPVEVIAEDGTTIQHYAMTDGDWMSEEFVPFTAEIDISSIAPQDVVLKLHRNNPSDYRENDMVMELPLTIVK